MNGFIVFFSKIFSVEIISKDEKIVMITENIKFMKHLEVSLS